MCTESLQSNLHLHPAPYANVPAAAQCPNDKTGRFDAKKALNCLCFIGEGILTKLVVQGIEEVIIY